MITEIFTALTGAGALAVIGAMAISGFVGDHATKGLVYKPDRIRPRA